MRSTRLAEAEDCEDDDIKGTAAAKEGEKQNDQGEEKGRTPALLTAWRRLPRCNEAVDVTSDTRRRPRS